MCGVYAMLACIHVVQVSPNGNMYTVVFSESPEISRISKLDEVDTKEVDQVLQLGYQRAVGMLLWAARHTFPECKYGVSRPADYVVSWPTETGHSTVQVD